MGIVRGEEEKGRKMVIYGVAVEYSSSYVIDVRWILQVGFAFLIRTWVHHPVMGRWFDCLFVWWLCFSSLDGDGWCSGRIRLDSSTRRVKRSTHLWNPDGIGQVGVEQPEWKDTSAMRAFGFIFCFFFREIWSGL
jgi:hypothetical protein